MKDNISSTKKSKKTRIVVYSWWFVQALVVMLLGVANMRYNGVFVTPSH